MTRCKFEVMAKHEHKAHDGSDFKIDLQAVTNGSEENDSFFKYTPSGQLSLGIVNQETADQFVIGEEYYIDITPCNSENA